MLLAKIVDPQTVVRRLEERAQSKPSEWRLITGEMTVVVM